MNHKKGLLRGLWVGLRFFISTFGSLDGKLRISIPASDNH